MAERVQNERRQSHLGNVLFRRLGFDQEREVALWAQRSAAEVLVSRVQGPPANALCV